MRKETEERGHVSFKELALEQKKRDNCRDVEAKGRRRGVVVEAEAEILYREGCQPSSSRSATDASSRDLC